MAKKQKRNTDDVPSLLTDLLITQLSVAGVQQQTIRQILGCDINRVSRITKHIKAARKNADTKA
jgi:hypothetical protein